MQIKVNGRLFETAESLTIAGLLHDLGYQDTFIAVAVNQSCVPKATYTEHHLSANDVIEILAPMAGG